MKLKRIPSVIITSLLLFLYAGCSSYLIDLQNALDEEEQETSSEVRSPTPVIIGPVTVANFAQVVASLTQDSTILVTGQVSFYDIIINNAIRSSNYLINLDLSNVTGLDTIRYGLFMDCHKLSGITLPDSVTSIEGKAFSNCSSLTSINIPENVTSIERWAFEDCSNLTITFSDTSTWYETRNETEWTNKSGGRIIDVAIYSHILTDRFFNSYLYKL